MTATNDTTTTTDNTFPQVRIGMNVFGALTGNWLGQVIAIYAEPRNGFTCVRIAEDAVTCRGARDIALNGMLCVY